MEEKNVNQNKQEKKELTSKGVILIAIGALLVVLIVAGTAAWYTRVTAINQLTMDAANFDFQADYSKTPFIILAKDYINIDSNGKDRAAPGTEGVVPIWISADESEIEVDYTMKLNFTGMDPEFRKRLRFYYIKSNENGQPVDINGNVITDFQANHPVEIDFDGTDNFVVKGSLAAKTGHYEYIYWRWVYDLNEKEFYYTGTNTDDKNKWLRLPNKTQTDLNKRFNEIYPDGAAAKTAFDELDTKIALGEFDEFYPSEANPKYKKEIIQVDEKEEPITVYAYQQAMAVSIDMTGAQAIPKYDTEGSVSVGGTFGSAYVPVGEMVKIHNANIYAGQ